LIARIRVILKRINSGSTNMPDENALIFRHGAICLDTEQHALMVADRPVDVTATEFKILRCLLARPRMVFTRDQILNNVYDENIHVSDRTIDSHNRNIRSKMGNAQCDDAIETVHGTGFRLGACQVTED
jgi:two-component system OmpR family response regulator